MGKDCWDPIEDFSIASEVHVDLREFELHHYFLYFNIDLLLSGSLL